MSAPEPPETPDPGIPQDPGIPGHREPEQVPAEEPLRPEPSPEGPEPRPDDLDDEGHRTG
jgi:hypothetical protein